MPTTPSSSLVTASQTLRDIIELASHDLPFAAQVAQIAWQSRTLGELALTLDSLYRIALDQGHSFLPDLVDSLLRTVENARDEGTPESTPWREVV